MDRKYLDVIKKDRVYAIIPARSGSKGVKDKNILELAGFPMIAYSIQACLLCVGVDRTIVSTDSKKYADIARKYGADIPFIRPKALADDKSTDLDFMRHAIDWLYKNEGCLPEFFMHIRPTYPLRNVEIMETALKLMKNDRNATSLRSAHLSTNTPYKWFNLREDGYFKSIRDDITLDEANNPRQDFPDVYIPDGYVDILKTDFIVNNNLLHGNRMIGFVVPDGIDIDAMKDVEYLKSYLSNNSFPLLDCLKNNYNSIREKCF